MAEPLKNIYNENFIDRFCNVLSIHLNEFDKSNFKAKIFNNNWNKLELKERMRHITLVLHAILPKEFKSQVQIIKKIIPKLRENGFQNDSLEFIFLPDFIEIYGQNHIDLSLNAIKDITQFVTCEFAIRPYLLKHPNKTLTKMKEWSLDNHWAVRRLSSEGSRPRLPWAAGIPSLKKDPTPILPILSNLKHDPSESVRRSVANNINDISKDHPDLVINLIRKWMNINDPKMVKLVKHASRTLLKQGHKDILPLFGYNDPSEIEISSYTLDKKNISVGDYLHFNFRIKNNSSSFKKLRLEYKIYYQKANGNLSPKVYMIQEREFPPLFIGNIKRKQSFKPITTRKFHKGLHKIGIVINGIEKSTLDFYLS